MNDIITPSGFDLTKNLHGHVRVETRSRWTGRVVDSQEKENLVTNALSNVFKPCFMAGRILSDWFTPIYAKALGGLFVFSDTLTESASNVHFPMNAKLIAYAAQDSNTSNVMGGSLNAAECLFTSNGYTSVWDFLTSQANGTIASIARTSYLFKSRGLAADPSSSHVYDLSSFGPYSLGSGMYIIGYDATNKYLYVTTTTSQTYNGNTYPTNKIYKTYCDFEKKYLLPTYFIPNPDKWTEVVTISSSTDGTSNASHYSYDAYSDNFFYVASGSTKKIYIISTSGTRSQISIPANAAGSYQAAATENYYWYINSGSTLYRVKKSNPVDTDSFTVSASGFTPYKLVGLNNDGIMVGASSGYLYAFVYSDLTVVFVTLDSGASYYSLLDGSYPSYHSAIMFLGDYFGRNQTGAVLPLTGYLGTIANLDSPVTKTSSQTMKITYTLTEA